MAVEYEDEKAQDTRHWYQKKRYGIPLAIFTIYLIVGSIFGVFDEEPEEETTESSEQQVDESSEQQDIDSEAEPTPEPKPAGPEFEDLGEFPVLNESGTGSDVFTVPTEIVYGAIEVSHFGSSNFIIEGLDSNNDITDLYVNETGNYEGTVGYGLGSESETTRISIEADGEWELSLKPLYTQPELPESGTGSGVYLFEGDAPVFEITHQGESNFLVQQIPLEAPGELLVNEIGVYSGAVPGVGGKSLVVIEADGNWQINQR